MELHLQVLIDGSWQRAALLEFSSVTEGRRGGCIFEYEHEYLVRWISDAPPLAAASLTLPVEFGPKVWRSWPAFLDDVQPMGSARSWWLRRLNLPDEAASDFEILRRGTIAPVGNLRIEEAVPEKKEHPKRFPRQAVIDREHAFIGYAASAGAQVGGATGAGGDSPKLLLRCDDTEQVWIDVWQDDLACPDRHYLVKFARSRSERDRNILRSEHVYYKALAALGVETIPQDGLALHEGPSGPSLWLPRFDVARQNGREIRYGLESIYSLLGAKPGSFQRHQAALTALHGVIPEMDWPTVRLEYLKRDLLNQVFGNSDNHCRNIAVLKTDSTVRLAPVFDFAPMKMDLEGITRTTTWEGYEVGGEVDWDGLLRSFGPAETSLRQGLRQLALRLCALPELLTDLGLPEETLNFAPLDFRGTEKRLRAWGLL
ncbi:type II toxin-antitoxin system HipA family toxin [Corallococcus exercitus]|uniref:Type II toxin-antitoxin system HipA family toxin n=1 Tax=Corallococcus exercitus TaxID=2316736 RepID=A0A7Y4NEZ1_9BACT|nr:HipA domain-containing protein [Corallococcus exercitus]NOK10390.1 type II toxin-antitoxin system HipA family toxin [Corallococcus exercitus]